MKIYIPEKKKFIRLTVRCKGSKSIYLTFTDATLNECMNEIEYLVKPLINLVNPIYKIGIDFRESLGGENLKSKTFSFNTNCNISEIENLIKQKYLQ